jgi:hypothetical protein
MKAIKQSQKCPKITKVDWNKDYNPEPAEETGGFRQYRRRVGNTRQPQYHPAEEQPP